MINALFQIIVFPIFAILEITFDVFFKFYDYNITMTIFIISLFINLISLPLYIKAEKLRNSENEIQQKLRTRVESIKKYAKGDEKYLLLQTYYRQNNYHPFMVLRTSLSLLLQIPFFAAAYIFFNSLPFLNNYTLFGKSNLASPDALLNINGLDINILPVIMTVINLIAGLIYSSDKRVKDKILIWVFAIGFLLILYNSPSALVLYWTYNNIFSLIKNIILHDLSNKKQKVQKSVNPDFSVAKSEIQDGLKPVSYKANTQGTNIVSMYPSAQLLGQGGRRKMRSMTDYLCFFKEKEANWIYLLSSAAICILVGFVLPSSVISASPVEFSFIYNENSPFYLMRHVFLQALGFFIFWGLCLYYFINEKYRSLFAVFSYWLLCIFIFDVMTNKFMGIITNTMQFDIPLIFYNVLKYNINENLYFVLYYCIYAIILMIIFFIIFKTKFKFNFLKTSLIIFITSFLLIGIYNCFNIYKTYKEAREEISSKSIHYNSVYNFSPNNKNVLIIILDRAIGSYLPLIFEERPELAEIYSGFTYYPNTVSFSDNSITAYPAVVGGYDYTPFASQKRSSEKCVKKHDEALLFMPLMFKNNNWNTTVTDAPNGHYKYVTPKEMFTKHGINYENLLVNTTGNMYKRKHLNSMDYEIFPFVKRNLLYFGFLRVLPPNFSKFLYKEGNYHNLIYKGIRINQRVINFYSQLFNLSEFTSFSSDKPSFILMYTALTHEPRVLTPPDYELLVSLKSKKQSEKYNRMKNLFSSLNQTSWQHYNVNAAAFILLGKYFNYLKENRVYDNTRIIIVSDHGTRSGGINNPLKDIQFLMGNNPVLFVKDFNEKGNYKTSYEFMTNADVVELAAAKVINNPKNPYTNKPITKADKSQGVWIITDTDYEWSHIHFNRTKPIRGNYKISHVKGDIYNKENMTKETEYKNLFEKNSQ